MRRSFVGLAAVLAAGLTLGGAARGSVPAAGPAIGNPGASALIAHLSVLQRPHTSADRFPADKLPAIDRKRVVSSLSRLVATLPGAKIYMFVLTPLTGPVQLWSPKLGDVVGLVSITTHESAELTFPIPASGLADANRVGWVVPGSPASALEGIQIVPNGVAQVSWTIPGANGAQASVIQATPVNNVALAHIPNVRVSRVHARWAASDGTGIATSFNALTKALAVERVQEHHEMIREAESVKYTANQQLLAAFKIFEVTSRTGFRVGTITVSHPRISALPEGVLLEVIHSGQSLGRDEIDPAEIREATTQAGAHIFIEPGQRGLCVDVNGGGGACTPDLAQALKGTGFTVGDAGHGTWHYGIRPDRFPTLTITTNSGKPKTLQLADGIFAYHTGP